MSERRISMICALLVSLGPVSMALLTPAMPELVRAFQSTPSVVKATITLYFAGFALGQLVAGPVSDAFGRRRATMGFLAIFLAGSVLAALAWSIEVLIAARLIQGIGVSVGIAVSRAIVRDLFVGEQASRIMNAIGIMLAVAPALSPSIGGLVLSLFNWHAIFVGMIVFGLVVGLTIYFWLQETTVADPAKVRPGAVARAYLRLVRSGEFMAAALVVGLSMGVIYTLSTILPFILIDSVGLTPTQFGLAMLLQSGAFFTGSVVVRFLMGRHSARGLVPVGLLMIAFSSCAFILAATLFVPTLLTVMLPVSGFVFGIAFIMPHMMMAGLASFPTIAGSASALTGFFQMGFGLLGGSIAALIGNPELSITIVIPAMGAGCVLAYLWHSRLVHRREDAPADITISTVRPAE